MTNIKAKRCAVIFCVEHSDALSAAIALRSARSGLPVYIAGHQENILHEVSATLSNAGTKCSSALIDNSNSKQISDLFNRIAKEGYRPQLVVHGGGRCSPYTALETSVAEVEQHWRSLCFASFLIGKEAIRRMLPQRQGTLLFLGNTAARTSANVAPAFAAASAGMRSLAQSMAREFGPKGIHVAHLMLDASHDHLGSTANAVAETCWQLHQQHITTWTHELDLLPAIVANVSSGASS